MHVDMAHSLARSKSLVDTYIEGMWLKFIFELGLDANHQCSHVLAFLVGQVKI